MQTYKVSELIVIKLDAGKDRNGNPRRCYVLTHALDGFLDCVDEGYEGESSVRAFSQHAVIGLQLAEAEAWRRANLIRAELLSRITTKIDTSPSQYRHFIAKRFSTVDYTITL